MTATPERFSFDDQAGAFERRTGIPPQAAEVTAQSLAAALLPGDRDLLLDMGAGSGELGQYLAQIAPRYLGIDVSLPMLAAFQEKRPGGAFPLAQADGDAAWPVRAASVRVVFFSRSAHLMDLEHLVAQLRRVAHPDGAWVVIGRVEREPTSMRSLLRDQMLTLLDERAPDPPRTGAGRGRGGRGGGRGPGNGRARRMGLRLESALVELGAEVKRPEVGGRWMVEDTLDGVLDDWRSKSGLGGRDVDPGVKHEVLEALAQWGAARFGTLGGRAERCERRFEWTPIRLPHPIPHRTPSTHVQAPSQ